MSPAPHRPHRPHSPFELSARHQAWVFTLGTALAASGVLWILFHYFLARPDEFGATRHPLEIWWLRLHGAAAMGFLVVLGSVLPVHARRAWHARLNYRTGISVLSIAAVLVLTGYGLYYAGDELLRPWMSVLHWAVGLLAAPLLWLHAVRGKRAAARRAQGRPHAPGHSHRGPPRR